MKLMEKDHLVTDIEKFKKETRYCIEYVNPQYLLREDGSLNIRYNRALTLNQAENDLVLILSFGGKILSLYMGNVVDGKTGEWEPTPAIVDDDDWFSDKWLDSIKAKNVDLEKEKKLFKETLFQMTFSEAGTKDSFDWDDMVTVIDYAAKHFFELGLKASKGGDYETD